MEIYEAVELRYVADGLMTSSTPVHYASDLFHEILDCILRQVGVGVNDYSRT